MLEKFEIKVPMTKNSNARKVPLNYFDNIFFDDQKEFVFYLFNNDNSEKIQ